MRNSNQKPAQRYLTINEAAEALCVSTTTIRRWVQQKRLSAVKTTQGRGGRLRIQRDSVERFYDV